MPTTVADLRRTSESSDSPYLLHHVRVTEAVKVSPSFLRITVTGPELDTVKPTGLDQRINLIFPLARYGLEPMAMVDDWYGAWRLRPDDQRNPIRTYTVRALRPERSEMDILVVTHGPTGPAGIWAHHVRPGDDIMLCAPNVRHDGDTGGIDFDPPTGCSRFLLVGDETAAPAIASILDCLPGDASGTVVVELPDADDAVIIPAHPGFDVQMVVRKGARGADLVAAVVAAAAEIGRNTPASDQGLEDVDVDVDILWEVPRDEDAGPRTDLNTYAWLAGEAGVIKQLRRQLVSGLGWDRRAVAFMGYWREGRAEN